MTKRNHEHYYHSTIGDCMNQTERVLNLLLVEDDPSDIRIFKDIMKQCIGCWQFNVVSDGEEAMNYLRKKDKYFEAVRPNLILLDLNMPKKDGREVLSEIKSDPELTAIPVIILTTSQSELDIQTSYKLHASSFVTKPRERKDFIGIIKGLDNYWSNIATPPTFPKG